ncbi:Ser/Thr protein phosphatase family [Eremomyces bilateralis CBS 781.70]|uniref:Ser/Thr protein phosphatase family n=1 Tax=Eremomyces bilateralis CBS 781.70 TaxID=1392243 RepID=A0A6G1G4D1_9PEZI|nr:Ser/Thr protein phosphatase family [Eremomyces bilateralis CBS 781.70]KAF1812924.1 Ser/Thr protein phosphatase family [Eremomyces bilateralis CBS 781.70]
MFTLLFGCLAIVTSVWAAQPSAPDPIPAPLRDLPWGELNFLHTTDTHGWLGGHLQEPSFSADWGDYISFTEHLDRKANGDNVDLLLIDTGDRVEGNGLYDSSEPKGRYLFDIYKQQRIDLICSGNHELYKRNSSENEFNKTVPHYKDGYISSNIDIYSPETGELVPLAPRFRKLRTRNKGYNILAFGFLFDFTGNANNTAVNTVEDTIGQKWFQDAIRDDDLDLIVIIGHIPVRSKEYTLLFRAIRSVKWDIPIQFFGGHMHIRDFKVYDRVSTAIASGRFMETIGWLSISGLPDPEKPKVKINEKQRSITASPSFSRRYIDNNLFSLMHHARMSASDFPTKKGQAVSKQIEHARHALNLDKVVGCAPQDYYLSKRPYPSRESIITWLEELVLPTELQKSKRSTIGIPAFAILNTGAIRFDLFKGVYTRDTTFLVSPFTSGFKYIPDIEAETARKVLQLLNSQGPILEQMAKEHGDLTWLAPPEQVGWLAQEVEVGPKLAAARSDQVVFGDDGHKHDDLVPGYTTNDDHGDDGDDTIHQAVKFYQMPNCIMAEVGPKDPKTVDLAYIDFVEPWVLLALRFLGVKVPPETPQVYMDDKILGTHIEDFIRGNIDWKPKDGRC